MLQQLFQYGALPHSKIDLILQNRRFYIAAFRQHFAQRHRIRPLQSINRPAVKDTDGCLRKTHL